MTTKPAPAASRTSRTVSTCPTRRAAQATGPTGERRLRLGDADRQVAVAGRFDLGDLLAAPSRSAGDVGRAVGAGGDRLAACPSSGASSTYSIVSSPTGHRHSATTSRARSVAPRPPPSAQWRATTVGECPSRLESRLQQRHLGSRVLGAVVQRDHAAQGRTRLVMLSHVPLQVRQPRLEGPQVRRDRASASAAPPWYLSAPDRGDHDHAGPAADPTRGT